MLSSPTHSHFRVVFRMKDMPKKTPISSEIPGKYIKKNVINSRMHWRYFKLANLSWQRSIANSRCWMPVYSETAHSHWSQTHPMLYARKVCSRKIFFHLQMDTIAISPSDHHPSSFSAPSAQHTNQFLWCVYARSQWLLPAESAWPYHSFPSECARWVSPLWNTRLSRRCMSAMKLPNRCSSRIEQSRRELALRSHRWTKMCRIGRWRKCGICRRLCPKLF